MKYIPYQLIIVSSLLFLNISCSEDDITQDISRATSIPHFTILGDNPTLLRLGEQYQDQGAEAVEFTGGVETVIDQGSIETLSNIDPTKLGQYEVKYRATNSQGDEIISDVSRIVIVYNDEITGVYSAEVTRTVQANGTTATKQYPTITLVMEKEGIYSISDWIGGWYQSMYGSAFAFYGYMGIDAAGSVSHLSSTNPWRVPGDLDYTAPHIYDPATKTIKYMYVWSQGYDFDVTLTKQ